MKNSLAKANGLFLLGGLCIVALFAYLGFGPRPAAAVANNQTINFQGRLLNSQGAAVNDGFYNVEFKIYQDGDGQSAGDTTGSPSGTLKWTEDHLNSASKGVKVVNGFMSVQLGSVTAFGSNIDWNQGNLWLSMNIGDTSSCTITTNFTANCTGDGEMLPMQPLTASPYSMNSGALNGLTSNNFVQLAQGVQTDASTASSIFINKTGASGSVLELQKGGVDVMNVSNTGTVLFQPSADSAAALQVKNHANGYSVFSVDTSGNAVVLGQASSLTGKLQFATAGGGTLTINPTSSGSPFTITLPAETGTVCTSAASSTGNCTNFAAASSLTGKLNKDATDTSSAAGGSGYLYGFTSTGSSTGGVLSLNNSTNTGSTLSATTAGNPASGKAVIFGSNTNASPSGNLIDLQAGSSPTSKFSVNAAGDITNASTIINSDTLSGTALTFGGASAATIQPAASQGLTITGHATSTWSLDAGNLTIQASAASATLSLDAGAATNGTVNLGNTTASAVNIANSQTAGVTVSIAGANNTSANTVSIANGATAANTTVNILSGAGTAGAGTLNLANNTRVTTIAIGNVAPAAARTTTIAGGNSGVVDTVNIATGNGTVAGAKTVHIADGTPTGSGTNIVTIGSIAALGNTTTIQGGNGAGAVSIQAASGGTLSIGTSNNNTVNIGTATTTGTLTLGGTGTTGNIVIGQANGANSNTISIGSNIGASGTQTINIGTNPGAAGTTNIVIGNTNAGTIQLQPAGGVLLGKASSVNGTLVFNNSAGSGTATISLAANPTTSYNYQLPTGTVNSGQCLQAGTVSGGNVPLTFGACGASGTFLNKNATDTSSAAGGSGYLYGFTSTGSSTGGVLSLNNSTNTGSTLNATTAGNPASGKAVIYGENTNASPSGNLLDLRSGSTPTSKFSVDASGNVLASGTYNTNTFTGSQLIFGSASAASVQSAASQALNITGNASSTWSVGGTNQNLTIQTSGTGTLALDTAGAGTVNIGTGNATTIGIGNNSTTSITIGGATSTGTVVTRASGITRTLTGSATTPSDVIKTSTDNSGAFQVQNHNSQSVFSVDTSGNKAVLGLASTLDGTLLFQNHTNGNGITINSTGANASYTLTLPAQSPSGGLCIQTSTGNASQLVFASCANNNTSISKVAYWDANSTNVINSVTPSTVGDVIVLTTQIPNTGVTVSSIASSNVTTWNKVVANNGNGTVSRVEMWVGTVTSLTTSNITVTYTGGTASGEEVTATEFTAAGVNQSTSWGIESSSSQLNSTASTTVTYPSLTAVNGAELYIGYAQAQNPPVTCPSCTTFTPIQTTTQHNMIEYNPSLTANTNYQPTAVQSSSGQSNTVAAILTAFVTSTAINNSTSLQKANFYVQAANAGSVAGVLQAASSGSADILDLRNSGGTNVVTVGSTGDVAIKSPGSTTALQVQNSSNYNVMSVDTTGNSVVLGDATHLSGSITFKDSGDSNYIAITAPTSVAASYSLALPNNTPTAGLCLATSPSNANQLIFASCATQVSAATISYVNKWDSHSGGPPYTIADSPTSIGNLLVVYSHVSGGATVSGISGGGVSSGGWTKVTAYTGAGTPGNIEMWRGVVNTVGSGTITVSYTGTVGTYEIVAEEFTMGSANGTWAIDTSGTATTTSSVTTVNYPSLTPLNSNELYAGYAYGAGTMSLSSPTSGFTYVSTGASKYLTYKTNVVGGTPYAPVAQQTSGVYASIAAIIEAYVGTSVIVNTTATQQANFNVQASVSGTVAGVLQAATSGTADIFQAIDSSGNNVMTINTSNVNGVDGVTLGAAGSVSGQLTFNASGNTNSVTLIAPTTPGTSYNLKLPSAAPAPGQCLASSPSDVTQLVFSSCANQVTSVAISLANNWKVSTTGLTPSLSITPVSVGDLITFFIYANKNNTINSVSGCGITWSRIVTANSEEMWRGIVTSTSTCSISASISTPSGPTDELAAQEWTTGSTNGSWVIDASGTISNSSSTTVTYPNLTPQSTKDLYIGYAIGTSTMSNGVTSGYSWLAGGAASNLGAYNTAISAATQPTASQSGTGTSIAAAALIAAYSSSSVIANSTNTQQANFNIQAATSGSVAGTLQAFYSGTGDILDMLNGTGTLVGSVDYQGDLLVRPSTANAAAFQVQNTSNTNILSVDTSAAQVKVGAGSTGESSVSLLVIDSQTGNAADLATAVNGAMYYNATTHEFRCGVAGAWQNCSGLLSSNASQSSANNNCSNNCAAFSTYAPIPANYCQAGRVIKLNAHGYFSSTGSPQLQFGVYYGTDNSVASNDTLIGTLTPALSVTSATNNYFGMDFDITCFSTTSMQADGLANVQVGTAAAGVTGVPISSTSATTVVSTSAKNLYIFPVWSAASASNTAKITQFIVSSP